jgi:hypothetical protein
MHISRKTWEFKEARKSSIFDAQLQIARSNIHFLECVFVAL